MTDLRLNDLKTIQKLGTEQPNAASADLDTRSALEIARIINQEDAKVAAAVEAALPQIARAIEAVADAIGRGGRLIYIGAGTSGRIGALDAAECPPTFNVSRQTVRYVIAGGDKALGGAAEFNEDSQKLGERDLARLKPNKKDVVIGIAASGRTPYTLAAMRYASKRGSRTVSITCNAGSPMQQAADIGIAVEVGPEVLSGSTRMKAGTAQKLVCNMISTGAMARLGYIYGNLMVNVAMSNEKLVERGVGILQRAAASSRDQAVAALKAAKNQVPVALVMLSSGVSASQAAKRLKRAKGNVRKAMTGRT